MAMTQHLPLKATVNAEGHVEIEWLAEDMFPVSALEDMFLIPMHYADLPHNLRGGAPVPRVVNGKGYLTALEVKTLVGLLRSQPELRGAERILDKPLEGEG